MEDNNQKLPERLAYDRGGRGAKQIKGVKIMLPGKPKATDTPYEKRESAAATVERASRRSCTPEQEVHIAANSSQRVICLACRSIANFRFKLSQYNLQVQRYCFLGKNAKKSEKDLLGMQRFPNFTYITGLYTNR
jgi:hypothetical protein